MKALALWLLAGAQAAPVLALRAVLLAPCAPHPHASAADDEHAGDEDDNHDEREQLGVAELP